MDLAHFWMTISFIFTTLFNDYCYTFDKVPSDTNTVSNVDQPSIDVIKTTLKMYFEDKRTVTVLWLKDENNELLNAIVNDTSLKSLFMHFDNLE